MQCHGTSLYIPTVTVPFDLSTINRLVIVAKQYGTNNLVNWAPEDKIKIQLFAYCEESNGVPSTPYEDQSLLLPHVSNIFKTYNMQLF